MRFLLDTHLLLRVAMDSPRLSERARQVVDDEESELSFSAASIWEVAIKNLLGRDDFSADPRALRLGLLRAGFVELPIDGEDAAATGDLPAVHRDPFDRLILAQARRHGLTLLTSDRTVASYGNGIELL
ncbi:MAG: type II toxin-antitoxin system VapC family toxin [Nocardioidaceae bacterium]